MTDSVASILASQQPKESNFSKVAKYLVNDSIPAQAVKSLWSGFTYPGDVYAGLAPPDDIQRAIDFAGLVNLGGLSQPVSAGEIRIGFGVPASPKIAPPIEEFAKALGADLSLLERSSGDLILSKIVVPRELRGSGIGSEIMNRIIMDADANGRTVSLTPSSDFGGSKSRLLDFYKRFGFEPNSGKSRDYSISETMRRYPQLKPGEI